MKRDVEKDLNALLKAFAENLEISNCEFGGIGLNGKRPFGNSDVENDILTIIGWEIEHYDEDILNEQYEYARDLYFNKLIPYIKTFILHHPIVKTFDDNIKEMIKIVKERGDDV